jgi:hypothetical protein
MARAIQPIEIASSTRLPKVVTSYSYNRGEEISPPYS